MSYFSDRHLGPLPRVTTDISEDVAAGIVGLIRVRASDGWFGLEYPEQCPDGRGTTGTDIGAFAGALMAHRMYNPFQRNERLHASVETISANGFGDRKCKDWD